MMICLIFVHKAIVIGTFDCCITLHLMKMAADSMKHGDVNGIDVSVPETFPGREHCGDSTGTGTLWGQHGDGNI